MLLLVVPSGRGRDAGADARFGWADATGFVPAKPQPVLRTLTRHRTTQIAERQRGVNRLHTALEHTGSKLDCLATDILDRSRRAMLDALVAGTTTTSAGAEGVRGAPLDGEDAVERARVDAAQRP